MPSGSFQKFGVLFRGPCNEDYVVFGGIEGGPLIFGNSRLQHWSSYVARIALSRPNIQWQAVHGAMRGVLLVCGPFFNNGEARRSSNRLLPLCLGRCRCHACQAPKVSPHFMHFLSEFEVYHSLPGSGDAPGLRRSASSLRCELGEDPAWGAESSALPCQAAFFLGSRWQGFYWPVRVRLGIRWPLFLEKGSWLSPSKVPQH